jgi:hypothetical protein
MSNQVEFGEIDFEAIEYRNEYRHKKSVQHVEALVARWANNYGERKKSESVKRISVKRYATTSLRHSKTPGARDKQAGRGM